MDLLHNVFSISFAFSISDIWLWLCFFGKYPFTLFLIGLAIALGFSWLRSLELIERVNKRHNVMASIIMMLPGAKTQKDRENTIERLKSFNLENIDFLNLIDHFDTNLIFVKKTELDNICLSRDEYYQVNDLIDNYEYVKAVKIIKPYILKSYELSNKVYCRILCPHLILWYIFGLIIKCLNKPYLFEYWTGQTNSQSIDDAIQEWEQTLTKQIIEENNKRKIAEEVAKTALEIFSRSNFIFNFKGPMATNINDAENTEKCVEREGV